MYNKKIEAINHQKFCFFAIDKKDYGLFLNPLLKKRVMTAREFNA